MEKLTEYANRFLRKKYPLSSVYPEQAAAFAAQLRAGCHQDLILLIIQCIEETPSADGKEALHALCIGINGEGYESWGMPDCACKKPDCVYCSTGMSTPPTEAA